MTASFFGKAAAARGSPSLPPRRARGSLSLISPAASAGDVSGQLAEGEAVSPAATQSGAVSSSPPPPPTGDAPPARRIAKFREFCFGECVM